MSTKRQIEEIKTLPVNPKEEWIMERREVDLPIKELEDVSPHLLICLSPDAGIIGAEVIPPDTSDSEALSWAFCCMLSPRSGNPRRPKSILLAGGALDALQPTLAQTGIQVKLLPESHPLVEDAVEMIEQSIGECGIPPYLTEAAKHSDTVADFFSAAAEYYKLEPWKFFPFEIPIKVTLHTKEQKTYWAVVMGVEGEQFGLSLLQSAEEVQALFGLSSEVEDTAAWQNARLFGFAFENLEDIGPDAEREYQKYQWALASKSAYPSAIVFDPASDKGPRVPNKKALENLIAVTRVVTEFCKTYSKQIKAVDQVVEVIEAKFTVPVLNEQVEASVEFPTPEFLEEEFPE